MSPVPGAGPAPKDPIGRLKEHPKSRARQQAVDQEIAWERLDLAEMVPLLRDRDKDLVRAALLICAEADESRPEIEVQLLAQIGGRDKQVAIAAIGHLVNLGTEEREAAVAALGPSELTSHIKELIDVARPRELKEALKGADALRARVAVAEAMRRQTKGEALLYEARSQKDPVVSGAALQRLRGMFLAGSLKPRARIDRFWLWRQKFRR